MSMHDDDRPRDDGVSRSATAARPGRRRKQAVAGAVGLAAVLGAGAYLITSQVAGSDSTSTTTDAGAIAPVVPSASGPSSATPPASVSASAAAPASASVAAAPASQAPARTSRAPRPAPSPSTSVSVQKEIDDARAAAAEDGHQLQRPRTAAPGAVTGPVRERNEKTANGTLRIVTARHDLTGQRELLWAADDGEPVGDARCTQTFQLSNEAEPKTRPTMVLCWRTSAERSVVTVAVAYQGKPSAASSVAVIDREWTKLG